MDSPFPRSSSSAGQGRIVVKLLPNGFPSLETATYQYPLKLTSPSRPSEPQSALVFLLSYGGGLVGGDQVKLSVQVQADSKLSLVTQGHTKIFKSATPNVVTRQIMDVHLAAGSALCLLPDPVQPFQDSNYEQAQTFRLAPGASLCLLDWVTQGRAARGEDWSFVRWKGRNEIWTASNDADSRERLLVRDAVILDRDQTHIQKRSLRETMHGNGIFGTLIFRGPLMQQLGDFFLAEFTALPRIGARDFGSDDIKDADDVDRSRSRLETWRSERVLAEGRDRLLWSAARVRGCVVVKFGAPDVEVGRNWIGSMLVKEGTISEAFGEQALLCVK